MKPDASGHQPDALLSAGSGFDPRAAHPFELRLGYRRPRQAERVYPLLYPKSSRRAAVRVNPSVSMIVRDVALLAILVTGSIPTTSSAGSSRC